MTLGIDVSPLFSEMVMASATNDLVQKKMVYLYLVNYAESNADLAILAVNTLQKDCRDDDPMIRGLALRSLCSLSLQNMVEYLQPAVQRAMEDVNGYVRKTAVIGVVKVFHISKSAVVDTDLLPTLQRLIHDSDAHVVANAIYAVDEVLAEEGGFQPTRELVTNMLNRLNQFSEWGQCAVLRLLTKYQVADEGEMFDIMNILDALLKQSSSAVVLAVTKIFVDLTSNRPDLQGEVLRRLKGPLLTLMAGATPELAYTVLAHIQALVNGSQAGVECFAPDFKQFYCRYNEPSYIKTVKIEILTALADEGSAEPIAGELGEYVTDVDAEIARRAIRAIGKVAVRARRGGGTGCAPRGAGGDSGGSAAQPPSEEMIVSSLTGLLELDIDYVSTEAAVVMKDLVRKYPQQFQRASGAVERCMKIVAEPEGKCAVLWILGEYGLLIEDAPYLLEPMIDSFLDEQSGAVWLEMLTAAVKLFFCRAPEMQGMLGRLLAKAIQESSHPDVRDRAMLYYRLLLHSPEEARRVICAPKEVVEEFQEEMDNESRERILEEFNTLSTIYKQPATKFVLSQGPNPFPVCKMQPPPADGTVAPPAAGGEAPFAAAPPPAAAAPVDLATDADLLGGDGPPPPAAAAPAAAAPAAAPVGDLLGMDDLLGGMDLAPVPPAAQPGAPFSLERDARMDGATFEARWYQLPGATNESRQCRPGVSPDIAQVEGSLRQAGIHVIASGVIPGSAGMKFFLFAQQASGPPPSAPGGAWFLMELVLTPGAWANATVKAEGAQQASLEGFRACFWQAMAPYCA
ncbi:unnamed protein product [Prorocentrum cordatum]|uniref:Beta-adaptin appendage C-terminal subdomain domain-containing protein n=1 Tax=Prorocentrum cordatum TaxID=2364126 RepID=A0ABN9VKX9_9DINO|nr:unnamed protein product [Polarella glacialis]